MELIFRDIDAWNTFVAALVTTFMTQQTCAANHIFTSTLACTKYCYTTKDGHEENHICQNVTCPTTDVPSPSKWLCWKYLCVIPPTQPLYFKKVLYAGCGQSLGRTQGVIICFFALFFFVSPIHICQNYRLGSTTTRQFDFNAQESGFGCASAKKFDASAVNTRKRWWIMAAEQSPGIMFGPVSSRRLKASNKICPKSDAIFYQPIGKGEGHAKSFYFDDQRVKPVRESSVHQPHFDVTYACVSEITSWCIPEFKILRKRHNIEESVPCMPLSHVVGLRLIEFLTRRTS